MKATPKFIETDVGRDVVYTFARHERMHGKRGTITGVTQDHIWVLWDDGAEFYVMHCLADLEATVVCD